MISKQKADYIRTLADAAGHIDPNLVVEAAKDPTSPIHDEFVWDTDAAAAAHWVETARQLIRFVKLEVTIQRQTVIAPFYVSDPLRAPKSRRYLELSRAARDIAIAQQVMQAELERIAAAIRRAQQIAAVLGMTEELADLLNDVTMLKTVSEKKAEEKAEKKRRKKRGGKSTPRGRARPELRT
jgi:NTP pyrophosphatase (non-canonical NTP hydrolase)